VKEPPEVARRPLPVQGGDSLEEADWRRKPARPIRFNV
jgi:hypothetical protein